MTPPNSTSIARFGLWMALAALIALLFMAASAPAWQGSHALGTASAVKDRELAPEEAEGDQDAEREDEADAYDGAEWLSQPVPVEQIFLWKVTPPAAEDGTDVAPSFLFGTIHAGVRFEEVMRAPVREAFESARLVFVELSQQELQRAGALMLGRMRLPADRSLSDYLDDQTMERLADFSGLGRAALERFEPWAVSLIFLLPATLPQVSIEAMDFGFGRAQSARGLERAEDQLDVFSGVPRQQWADEIRETLATWPAARREMRGMIEAYRAGDAEAMSEFVLQDAEDKAEMLELLLYARNRAWMPAITEAVNEGGAFVAVGLGHLLGEGSVNDLLQRDGYSVERILLEEEPAEEDGAEAADDDEAAE